MNIDKYFEELNNKLNNLQDKDLENILIEAGIDKCPFKAESYSFKLTTNTGAINSVYYKTSETLNDFSDWVKKVA